jgi:hypothetical protein
VRVYAVFFRFSAVFCAVANILLKPATRFLRKRRVHSFSASQTLRLTLLCCSFSALRTHAHIKTRRDARCRACSISPRRVSPNQSHSERQLRIPRAGGAAPNFLQKADYGQVPEYLEQVKVRSYIRAWQQN